MRRYLKGLRIVAIAGLMSLALAAIPAAPAGAKLVCPPGTSNKIYCKRKLTIKVHITITGFTIHVTITVTDPHVKVLLLHNGHVIKQVFNGRASGTFHLKFAKPTQAGLYEVKAIATARGVTKTRVKKFRVGRSLPAKKKGVGFTG